MLACALGAEVPFSCRSCGWVSAGGSCEEVGREGDVVGIAGRICDGWTSQGSHPPGACLILASSRPRRRGIDGPVRSISRIPTALPARDRESASWVVTEDFPTPPLPERTCQDGVSRFDGTLVNIWLTRMTCLTLASDMSIEVYGNKSKDMKT